MTLRLIFLTFRTSSEVSQAWSIAEPSFDASASSSPSSSPSASSLVFCNARVGSRSQTEQQSWRQEGPVGSEEECP